MAFAYKRSVTIDHTKCGSSDSSNFPVLVKISDATFKTVGNSGHIQNSSGYDIAFYSDSGLTSALFWEIDFYDGVNGVLWAWVKVSTVSHSSDTVIYVGYGDAGISTFQSTASSVWSNSYTGVYHLGNGTTLNLSDSTTNGYSLSNVNTVTAVAGQIDGGANIAVASSQYLSTPNNLSSIAITMEGWLKASSFPGGYNTFLSSASASTYCDLHVKSNGTLALYLNAGSSINYDGNGVNTLSTGTWYHVVLVYDSTNGLFGYVNGGIDRAAGANGNLNTSADRFVIGNNPPNFTGRYFDGIADEVRVSSVARSADWILTEYNNQNSPSTFLTIGSETTLSASLVSRIFGLFQAINRSNTY